MEDFITTEEAASAATQPAATQPQAFGSGSSEDAVAALTRAFGSGQWQAALIDMDGVLYDSMGHHAEAWLRATQPYGFAATREDFYRWEGQTGAQTIDGLYRRYRGRAATADEIGEIYAAKCRAFEALGAVEAMAGARDVLLSLRRLGMTCVLVTGSGQATLLDRLERDFPGVFSWGNVVSARDMPPGLGKPDPAPYRMGLHKAGDVAAQRAVVIENAPLGVRSARAAGLTVVAVNTGPLPAADLAREGAAIVLGSMVELADIVGQVRP